MLHLYILLTLLSSVVWGRSNQPSYFCFGGCELALGIFKFNDTSPGPSDPSTLRARNGCDNDLHLRSFYICLRVFCTEDERAKGLNGMNETCQRSSNVTIPPFSIIDEYSDEDIARLRHLQPEEIPDGRDHMLNEVSVPSNGLFKLAFDTLDAVYFETRIHNLYGCAMYYFWTAVVSIGLLSHLGPYLLTLRFRNSKWQLLPGDDFGGVEEPPHQRSTTIFDTPYSLLKRYVTVPATFGYRRSQNIGWCTIPTRIQSLTTGAFIMINIFLCSCSYKVFPNNIYWPRVYDQGLRYFADRTGIISTANLPLIWLFGIRNNTLMWLTGWDFATYNNFHRWVARVSTFEAVLHSLAYTVMIVSEEGSVFEAWAYYLTYYQQRYFLNGVLATIFMVGILVASVYPLRRNFYEIFLWLHIILSVLVIITMYYHVEIFQGYANYIYPCIFIWIFDRILRLFRILSFNPRFWSTTATINYSPSSNIVRLSVSCMTSFIKPKPGTFYYIYVLDDWRFWENHPFTVGYATPEKLDKDDLWTASSMMSLGTINPPRRVSSPSDRHPISTPASPNFPHEEAHLIPSSPSSSSNPAAQPNALTFIIRPYNGFTSRLRTSSLYKPSIRRVLIEGPYGETQPLHKYTNILFIVGGTGIAVPLSYLRMLTQRVDDDPEPDLDEDEGKTLDEEGERLGRRGGAGTFRNRNRHITRKIKILWAVRERAFLEEVLNQDIPLASSRPSPPRSTSSPPPSSPRSPTSDIPNPSASANPSPNIDVAQVEEAAATNKIRFHLTAYVTGEDRFGVNSNTDGDYKDDGIGSGSKDTNTDTSVEVGSGTGARVETDIWESITILKGRPNISHEISKAATESSLSSISTQHGTNHANLAIITCGPSRMADDARSAVVSLLAKKGMSGVEYFEESFNW